MAAAPHTTETPEAPRKPYVLGTWLAYNPDETLAEFFARRATALQAGDQAWREGKIKAHHQKLYERLVDAVGAHHYSWIKVETLADEFKANESTIKRWLTVLEKQAKLIRRQRQFKTSSRTYLVTYDQWQAQGADNQAEQGKRNQGSAPHTDVPGTGEAAPVDDHIPQTAASAGAQAANADALFFERNDAPTYSAFVPPQIKDLPLNTSSDSSGISGGNKKCEIDITNIDPDIRAIIDDETINSIHGWQIVAARSLDELRAVQGYLDHQTNVRDRSGLFVWLNEREFGAQLLAGRVQAKNTRADASAHTRESTHRRRSARKAEQAVQRPESDYQCNACGHFSAYLGLDDGWCDQCGVHPGDELGKNDNFIPDPELWAAVLDLLNVDDVHRNLWLAQTMIAHYAEYPDHLILACPHKLVRDAIRTSYVDCIEAVASTILGRPVRVDDVKVKYMPEVTAAQRAAWEHSAAQDASTTIADEGNASFLLRRPASGDDPWPKMVAHINPPTQMSAIFERCSIAHQTPEHLLVIATPNCIVRDELRDTWLAALHAAAGAVLGHTVDIELIIDGPPPTLQDFADQRPFYVPARVAHNEAHNSFTSEHVDATALVAGNNAGKNAPDQEQHTLSTEERERFWRAIPWRLPIRSTERAMWFPQTHLHQCVYGRAIVTAPTAWQVEQLKRYQNLIEDELGMLVGQPITIAIVVAAPTTTPAQQEYDHKERGGNDAVNVVRS